MATIKQLVGRDKAEVLFALKDQLKRRTILDENPLQMNRHKFESYLAAKAESIIVEATSQGVSVDDAFRKAEAHMTLTDGRWRQEAKRLNEMKADIDNAVQHLVDVGLVDA